MSQRDNSLTIALTRTHADLDARSLELHRIVAAKIETDPSLRRLAIENLERWESAALSGNRGALPAFREWRRLLTEVPLPVLLAVLRSDSERATQLRQSTPFAGVLSEAERMAVFQRVASQRARRP